MTPVRAKDPRQIDRAHKGFVAGLPCVACMVRGVYNRRVHVAHLRMGSLQHGKRPTGGAEKPSDRWCVSLCPAHHTGDVRVTRLIQHDGEEAFWAELGINPFDLCIALWEGRLAGRPGGPIIAAFAAQGRRAIEERLIVGH